MFAQLPSEPERHALLEALGELVEQRGSEPLLTWPILLATHEHFPDAWAPDVEGVRTMLLRLMQYAGLGAFDAHVEVFVDEDRRPELLDGVAGEYSHRWHGTAAWFQGIDGNVCLFGVELSQIEDAEQLVGVLAHEVAHAYRRHHGLVTDDPDHEEQLTDLTTVFLGFGLLTTNAADRSRSSGELNGAMVTHRWQRQQGGYLSPATMSFLLAAQVVARGNEGAERRRIQAALETNQAASFKSALSWLTRRLDDVRRQLHVRPGVATGAAQGQVSKVARPLGGEAPQTPPERGEEAPDELRPVFRFRLSGSPLFARMMFAALVGIAVAIPLRWLGTVLILPALWAIAERWVLPPVCSGCEARIGRSVSTCARCGGTVAGDIARLRDRHDAEERYWAERGVQPDALDDEDAEDPPRVAAGGG